MILARKCKRGTETARIKWLLKWYFPGQFEVSQRVSVPRLGVLVLGVLRLGVFVQLRVLRLGVFVQLRVLRLSVFVQLRVLRLGVLVLGALELSLMIKCPRIRCVKQGLIQAQTDSGYRFLAREFL